MAQHPNDIPKPSPATGPAHQEKLPKLVPAHEPTMAWMSDGAMHQMLSSYDKGFREGMVVGAAIIAWAEAIRVTHAPKLCLDHTWDCRVVDDHTVIYVCDHCGAIE